MPARPEGAEWAPAFKMTRKLVYRLLSWNPYQRILFRLVMALRC